MKQPNKPTTPQRRRLSDTDLQHVSGGDNPGMGPYDAPPPPDTEPSNFDPWGRTFNHWV